VGIWAGTTTDDRRHARAVLHHGRALQMTTRLTTASVVDQLLALASVRATVATSAAPAAKGASTGLQPVA
jgi:hypothetical protein